LKGPPGPPEMPSHRHARDSQRSCDLPGRQPFQLSEHEDCPLPLTQDVHRQVQPAPEIHLEVPTVRACPFGGQILESRRPLGFVPSASSDTTTVVVNGVHCDTVNPSGERVTGFEPAKKPKNANKNLLRHIFFVFGGNPQQAEYAQDTWLVASKQRFEGPLVPVKNLRDQCFVLAVVPIGGTFLPLVTGG